MSISKKDISKDISKNLKINIKLSSALLNNFINEIINATFKKSRIVKIHNFGTFKFKKTPKRVGRNPKTRELYIIPTRSKLKFYPSNKIRGDIN